MLTLPLGIIFLVLFFVGIGSKKTFVWCLSLVHMVMVVAFIVWFPCTRTHVDGLEVSPLVWDKSAFAVQQGQPNYIVEEYDRSYPQKINCFKVKVYDRYGSPSMEELPADRTAFVGIDTDRVRVHTFEMSRNSRLFRIGYNRRYVVVMPEPLLRTGENTLMQYRVGMYYQKDGTLSPELMRWIGTTDRDAIVAQAEAPPKGK